MINTFGILESNWNDNGAATFPQDFLCWLEKLVSGLAYAPEVFPTAADSVQLEYSRPDGAYLEFEIYIDRSIKAYAKNGAGQVAVAEKFVVAAVI